VEVRNFFSRKARKRKQTENAEDYWMSLIFFFCNVKVLLCVILWLCVEVRNFFSRKAQRKAYRERRRLPDDLYFFLL
jgi:hypothetical protein